MDAEPSSSAVTLSNRTPAPHIAAQQDGQSSNNAWIYLAIAVVILLAAIVVLVMVRRKHPASGPPTHS